jgi:hypothetical protein
MATIGDRGPAQTNRQDEPSFDCCIPVFSPSKGCTQFTIFGWDPTSGIRSCFWPEPEYHQVKEEESGVTQRIFDCWCCVFGDTPSSSETQNTGASSAEGVKV